MSLWESIRAFVRREAADAKEGLEGLRDRLDDELTRREQEMEATPSERIEMIKEDIDSSDSVFDELEAKIDARLAGEEAAAEVDEPPRGDTEE